MKHIFRVLLLSCILLISGALSAQDAVPPISWKVSSKRTGKSAFELTFTTSDTKGWDLYAPNQVLGDVATAEVQLSDSSFHPGKIFRDSGRQVQLNSPVFNVPVKVFRSGATFTLPITISGDIPSFLKGEFLFTYGKGSEYYPSASFPFSVALQGGVAARARLNISSIKINQPVSSCGDEVGSKSLWTLLLIGFVAGLLSLLFPCIFPLIPLTVSFFTKRSQSRKKGIINAFIYGFSIFIIYTLISLPFHIFDIQPEVLNNISTNVPLNLVFFAVFVVFAISFFGYFEITLPGNFANKVDSRSGLGDITGIFFMALTLAIVSFSCTSGILGALLVGSLGGGNGAWQLTAGMAGFGLGLGLPFLLFALFPNWLQTLPKSGGWMNELKVVFGFIELAMAIKFLSSADLVEQWGLLKREVFIGIWILISLAIVLYLAGIIRFSHDSKPKFTKARIFFILLFSAFTIYLLPGVTNTPAARLTWISGFPPPASYSIYRHNVNYEKSVEPLRDYEKALQLAKEQHKPLLIDFTGWACVNCRRMEENVWVNEDVKSMMQKDFVVVSLYVDDRKKLPASEQTQFKTKAGTEKSIITVGDKWSTFQSENFNAVSQPQYAIISPEELALTRTKNYTPDAKEFAAWLKCGINAYQQQKQKP